ncbi:MAG: hypothetical protein M0R22_13685 [Dehalococcoidia bacterium]|jgi:phage tail sheath gpL-like|nr:hypothetical protein [Dehalococcoidia bacterium]
MGTLALALTGISTNWLVPQQLIQVQFAQGTLLGDPSQPKVLLMGVKNTAGTATAGTQVYPLGTEAEVIDLFGTGSDIHVAWRYFTKVCKTANVYGIGITESAGTAATGTITFATNATGSGSAELTMFGETISVSFANGDAFDTTIAEAMKEAINDQTHWPVVATRALGVVNLAYRTKGTNGNWARYRVKITSGVGTTMVAAAATLTTGATDEVYTTALATILATKYDYIVPCINPTAGSDTRLAAVSAQVLTQALPATGIRQTALIAASADSLSNATTLVTAYNKAQNQIWWHKNSEELPFAIAAHNAGVRYNLETGADPGVSYDGYGPGVNDVFFLKPQYSQADQPTQANVNTALSVGLSPIAVDNQNKAYIVMSCTAAGADPRIRDTSKVTVSYRFAADLAARDASVWARAKVADNEPEGARPYPANICTPTRLKDTVITPVLRDYRDRGLLVSVDGETGSIASCATGIDPTVTTRINARIPINVTPLRHQVQFLVNEVSTG